MMHDLQHDILELFVEASKLGTKRYRPADWVFTNLAPDRTREQIEADCKANLESVKERKSELGSWVDRMTASNSQVTRTKCECGADLELRPGARRPIHIGKCLLSKGGSR